MLTSTGTQSGPELHGPGGQCPTCHAPLAVDQRYCLNCGQRLGEPRVEFRHALGLEPPPPPAAPRRGFAADRGPVIAVAAVAAILLALGVGIILGRGSAPSQGTKTTVVNVNGGGGSGTGTAASGAGTPTALTSVTDTWPSSASGWTVELSSLDSSTAQASDVSAAESAARAKGASAIGVLNGDNHSGTPTGKYVIYSGRFTTHAQAQAAKARLAHAFPGAIILHVTPPGSGGGGSAASGGSTGANSSQVQNLHKLSGSAYVKASAKLPSTVTSNAPPPPKDNKAAGGGTSGSCIGC